MCIKYVCNIFVRDINGWIIPNNFSRFCWRTETVGQHLPGEDTWLERRFPRTFRMFALMLVPVSLWRAPPAAADGLWRWPVHATVGYAILPDYRCPMPASPSPTARRQRYCGAGGVAGKQPPEPPHTVPNANPLCPLPETNPPAVVCLSCPPPRAPGPATEYVFSPGGWVAFTRALSALLGGVLLNGETGWLCT